MNLLDIADARDMIQAEIHIAVQDQGNHDTLTNALNALSGSEVAEVADRVTAITAEKAQVTYAILAGWIIPELA